MIVRSCQKLAFIKMTCFSIAIHKVTLYGVGLVYVYFISSCNSMLAVVTC